MPSPIAHAAAGYAIYRLFATRQRDQLPRRGRALPGLLLLVLGLSFVPDFDFAAGLIVGDLGRFHNTVTNSLLVGAAVAVVFGLAARWLAGASFPFWFGLALLAYEVHVVMDFLGTDRGAMLFWPLTSERFISPVLLFYGLHRSEGLWSISHVWTFLSEAAFAAGVYGLVRLILRRNGRRPAGTVVADSESTSD